MPNLLRKLTMDLIHCYNLLTTPDTRLYYTLTTNTFLEMIVNVLYSRVMFLPKEHVRFALAPAVTKNLLVQIFSPVNIILNI
jgi:hypothetical protein